MQTITLRKADTEDLGLIANLSWQTFFDTYSAFNTKEDMESFLTTNFSKDVVGKELADNKNTFIVAYLKREVVGYVKLSERDNPAGLDVAKGIELARLYSIKNKIGSGIGKALMEHSIAFARKKNADAIWLCVWSQNQRAIQFYRKFGFEKFGDYKFILGSDVQDDWLMKLDLSATLI